MKTYKTFRPTGFDTAGLGCDDQQDWLVHPCSHNRDSDCLTESNWDVSVKDLAKVDPEGLDHEIHRFGHWACGWFEIILVRPDTAAAKDAEETEAALENYPVLNDSDFSEKEQEAADLAWLHCYRPKERIEYIREHRKQFEFRSFADMLGCVRGKYFAGYASELLG